MSKGLIFTLLLTYGGALTSLFNPYVGLLIYVCFAIIRPESMWHWSVPVGNYSRIVALALVVGWAAHAFGRWRARADEQDVFKGAFTFLVTSILNGVGLVFGRQTAELGRGQLPLTLLLQFWLWACVSGLAAADQDAAWASIESFGKLLLIFAVGITTIDSVKKLRQLAWVIVLSQGYVAYELNLNYFNGLNAVFIDRGFGGIDNNCNAIAMVTCIGLAFFLGLSAARWWQTVLAFALALLMTHVVMFSFSRGGLLSLVVVGVVSFLMIPKRPVYYIAFGLAVLLALRLAGPEVRERFITTFADSATRDASAQSRLDLWEDCWDVMQNHPVLGVGPDHWPLIAHEYGWPRGKEAHSLWLQIGAEVGIPGMLLLVAFFGVVIIRVWRMSRIELPDPWLRYVGAMVIPSLLGFMVSAQFVSLKSLELPYYIALLGAGALKLASLPTCPACNMSSGENDLGNPGY